MVTMLKNIKQYFNSQSNKGIHHEQRQSKYNKKQMHKQSKGFEKKTYFMDFAQASWNKRDYQTFSNEAYIKNVIAHKAINIICRACSSIKLKPKFINAENESTDANEITQLLSKPNPKESGKELLYSLYAYRQIHGNAYLLANSDSRQINEFYSLRPDRVSIKRSNNFIPLKYQYSVGGRIFEYRVDNVTGFSNILHLKNFNPLDDFYGLSSIEAAAYSIDQHNQAVEWNQRLLQNGARPSGAIVVNNAEHGSNLTDEQFSRLRSMVDDLFCGPQNSGRPMILEGGLDWKEMSLTPKDMDFISCKNSAARDIALAFGVPPQLLGIPGDNTYSNLKEARLAFWEQTVIPIVENTLESLSNWFSYFYKRKVIVEYCLENVPVFSERRESLWDRIKDADFLTVNEKRKLVGYTEIPDGDNLK